MNPIRPDPDVSTFINIVNLSTLKPSHLEEEEVDKKFYLAFNFRAVNNTAFFNPKLYPYNQGENTVVIYLTWVPKRLYYDVRGVAVNAIW